MIQLHHHDKKWLAERLAVVPGAWRERVRKIHGKKLEKAAFIPAGTGKQNEAIADANQWLFALTDRMKGLRVPVNLSDAELCAMAVKCASECMSIANVYVTDLASLRERMNAYCLRYGITPPDAVNVTNTGAVARMSDHLWWRRNLRKVQARGLEGEAIALGYVHKRDQIYASDVTVERRGQQKRRNQMALENTEAINKDTGEIFTLMELAERSVANPKIRRGELMTRIAGFEAVAKSLEHAAEFVTLTTPSQFHPKRQDGGAVIDNPKFKGHSPRAAQQYLGKVWARIRAKLGRLGIRPYGFRIAEPHHDGTPHWHILLFVMAEQVKKLRETIKHYAMQLDGDEEGAEKYRCEFVAIDWRRGSAAGYVAKYVSKNIDGGGYEVQQDIEGHDAIVPSQRVEAWASTWGIRQFQQVGGPPVGVWRELRRTAEEKSHTDTVARARSASDAGNWCAYVEAMGGPIVPRKDLPISIARTRDGERWDFNKQQPEPAPLTRYWEQAKGAVFGVKDNTNDRVFQSRRYRWEVRPGLARPQAAQPWTRVNNCTQGEKDVGGKSIYEGGNCRMSGDGCAGSVEQSTVTRSDDGGGIRWADFGSDGGTSRRGFGEKQSWLTLN